MFNPLGSKTDILSVIKAEHREVSAMLDKALELDPGVAEIRALADQIETALTNHVAIEERLFYSRLRERAEESEQRIDVLEGYTEHEVAKHLIALLKSTRKRDETFKAELQVLCENVTHHVKEEESTIFSLARKYIPKEELEMLGDDWQRAKKRLESPKARSEASKKRSPARRKTSKKAK
jgi:hemerythrin superfamily protein